MKQKSMMRFVLYMLVAIFLVANATGVAASPGYVQKSGNVFTVYPSGGEDTVNIQFAFEQAVTAGSGSTVKLAAGNFTTRFIEVENFNGYFTGSGQNKTVIDTFADQDCQALIDTNRQPSLFNFYHGNVRVSDLSFHITPSSPCAPFLFEGFQPGYMGSWINILTIMPSPFISETDCMTIQKEQVSGSVTRVIFRGEQGIPRNGETDPVYSNIGESIVMGGSFGTKDVLGDPNCNFAFKFAQGKYQITETTHVNVLIGMIVFHTYNSLVLISGNSFDMGTNGIILENNSGSIFEVKRNQIKNGHWSGIWVTQGGGAKLPFVDRPAVFDINQNEIESAEAFGWWTSGILATDNENLGGNSPIGKTLALFVRNNHIKMSPLTPPVEYFKSWGIWLEGVDDALVVNNRVTGSASTAINTGSWGPSRRVKILVNDLTGFNSYESDPYKIVLGWGTEKYIVTGEPAANVANFGTDNLIAGLRFQTTAPYALDKLDSFKQIIENLKRMKGGFHLAQQ